ncbi:hypothetical protein P20429_3365 [Pseudoalteromonas sp. BSi20429]|nr:hypothetical protein P20429_3365 [Pseudoalteromonas sp. BSi20429]
MLPIEETISKSRLKQVTYFLIVANYVGVKACKKINYLHKINKND